MRSIIIFLIWTLTELSFAADGLRSEKGDVRDAFFADPAIWRLRIQLDDKAIASLKQDSHRYVTAMVIEGQTVYRDVGLHLKGNQGSFQPLDQKPSLTLNFDKFVRDQNFHGLDKLYLNNSAQDPTYMAEYLGSDLFRAAGVPAARVSYARIELNGRDLGLYVLVEGYDKSFLKRHFKNAKGNLYDSGFFQEITDPLELTAGDGPQDRSDLKTLVEAVRENDPGQRLERLKSVLDLDRFYSYLAVEIMASSWDGYALNKNNYRLYHDPENKRFVFIPSGIDQLFMQPKSPLLPDCSGIVAAGVLYVPEGRRHYRERCSRLSSNVFTLSRLTNLVNSLRERLRPAFAHVSEGATRQYDSAVDNLRERMSERIKHVTEEIGRATSLMFGSEKTAILSDWRPQITVGNPQLTIDTNERPVLTIKCPGGHAPSISSWRTRVELPKGRYRFEANVQAEGLTPMRNSPGGGVLLRVFGRGSSPVNASVRNGESQQLSCEFVVGEVISVEEFVCEVRAYRGLVSFAMNSLKVLRLQ